MKLLAVFGTRPEAIKMAPVIQAFQDHSRFRMKICVTAQHRSMLDQVLSCFAIKPDYDLNLMSANQSLVNVTIKALSGLSDVYQQEQPDWVFVQGDTTTTFAGTLAAFYHKIPVAHIEAGLRTHQMYSPWPEEINRQLISRIARLHFAPTESAKRNLLNEGIHQEQVCVTGNTGIDALQQMVKQIRCHPHLQEAHHKQFSFLNPAKKLILVTSHRRENFGATIETILNCLLRITKRGDTQIVFVMHLNPNILHPVTAQLTNLPDIFLLKPLEYRAFVFLMLQADVILTDSGGIQEEAPSLGKPVLVLRATTERQEGLQAGMAKLIGIEGDSIFQHIELLLDQPGRYEQMANASNNNPYGDGKAAQRIVERIEHEHDYCTSC